MSKGLRVLIPAILCLILGFGLAIQVKTQAIAAKKATAARIPDQIVTQLVAATEEIVRLRDERDSLKQAASAQSSAGQVEAELLMEKTAAGFSTVQGPGVTINLSPAGGSNARVAPLDILLLLNELKASGAEIIAVGGIQVTDRFSVTRIPADAEMLLVGRTPMYRSVRIEAIGDPVVLAAGLNLRGGVIDQLTKVARLNVTVTPTSMLTIPGNTAVPSFAAGRPGR